jgi:low affinity Fe/Cu permease
MERLAQRATAWAGGSGALTAALAVTVAWLASGPVFRLSDTWQLAVNTVSSVVTLLMVFLLQRAENKDALAMQAKLNEVVAALPRASNRVISVEDLPEAEVRALHEHYRRLRRRARAGAKAAGGSLGPGVAPPRPAGVRGAPPGTQAAEHR